MLLAVSGGPDSLALLLLASASRGRLRASGFSIHAATVDHALRPESAAEAAAVARLCENLDVPHATLVWRGAKPIGNLAAAAREARYRLLADHAETLGAPAVLTAHHEDDQIETHHMAMLRRAGDRGLAGMRSARALSPSVLLLRPLLAVAGARLKAAVAAHGLAAADDPSNRDVRFARARLRAALGDSPRERHAVLARIRVHATRRDAEDAELAAWMRDLRRDEGLAVDAAGMVRIASNAFRDRSKSALAESLLGRVLQAAGGSLHPPSRDAVRRLLQRLRGPGFAGGTLIGAVLERGGDGGLTAFREYGRAGLPAVDVSGASAILFDRRLRIVARTSDGFPRESRLAAFGATGRGNAREKVLPVLLGPDGSPRAAHPLLLAKLPAATALLDAREEISFRLGADLPVV
ncbi:tRNA lysidine(34) synthetase TilS [Aureimonas leprariae]|uniref:tRNA lysidine(34) synthetase TilS n=1 Tax=Plantimonas leprariae TaxID=2615207 RepID=UPI00248350E9|nr:tRNA lysidine(34) synthetase TilS [Aureimonas leprariae]